MKYIPKAFGVNLGRQERGLESAWLARHIAFEVWFLLSFRQREGVMASVPAFITGLCCDRLNRALDPS